MEKFESYFDQILYLVGRISHPYLDLFINIQSIFVSDKKNIHIQIKNKKSSKVHHLSKKTLAFSHVL